jgi:hypothetical protein
VALHVACDEAAGRAGCIECVADLLVRPATIGTNVMPDWRTAVFSYLTTTRNTNNSGSEMFCFSPFRCMNGSTRRCRRCPIFSAPHSPAPAGLTFSSPIQRKGRPESRLHSFTAVRYPKTLNPSDRLFCFSIRGEDVNSSSWIPWVSCFSPWSAACRHMMGFEGKGSQS